MCTLHGRAYDSIRNCTAVKRRRTTEQRMKSCWTDAPFSIWKMVYPVIKDQCISEDAQRIAAAAVMLACGAFRKESN